jgi:tetratricopeptide (TPR) repeat protein
MTNRKTLRFLFVLLIFGSLLAPMSHEARCESPLLLKGIELYKQEKYGEASKILEEARKEDPKSSSAAFFLGLTYKQLLDYERALPHLRDAVTLTPRIKEALVELIEVLYQLYEGGRVEEAKKWIEVAEREDIFPAKVAFLKGLILAKEGKNQDAVMAFEKAKTLDSTLAQAADVQIALCHLNQKEFKKARDRLQAAVQQDPTTDLAGFARQYQDLVEKRLEAERPVRITLSAFGQYDTNVVLKPTEGALAPDITNQDSRVLNSVLRLDYVPTFEGPFLFNAQYALGSSLHQRYSTTHDSLSNGIYLAPGYNFGNSALNLAFRYNHALVRNPSYKKYVQILSAGPLYRMLAGENQIVEFYAGYSGSKYYTPPLVPEEDRDSDKFNTYVNWVWLLQNGAFFNLRYEYSNEDTEGANWANSGHDLAFAATIPVAEKLSVQLSGELFMQDYRNTHSFFGVKRKDRVLTGTAGLIYNVVKNLNMILQYTHTEAGSNIPIYDYTRSIYSLGLEWRY